MTTDANATAAVTIVPGLQVTDHIVGSGDEAKSGQVVTVHYAGTLTNGKEFDASRNHSKDGFTFPLGKGRVIKGWDLGVAGMRVGGKRTLHIAPDLGYGAQGAGDVIPPHSTLVFVVELLSVKG